MKSINISITKALSKVNSGRSWAISKIRENWKECVGQELFTFTNPMDIKAQYSKKNHKKILRISTQNTACGLKLKYTCSAIKHRINILLGFNAIHDIEVIINEDTFLDKHNMQVKTINIDLSNFNLNLHHPIVLKIINILRDGDIKPRIIGGAVRDALLKKKSNDLDIATSLRPDIATIRLKANGFHVVETGVQYGTITAVTDIGNIEITTLRKDIRCTGRYATVEFCDSFEIDAMRRDFTINALSYCVITNTIYDYCGGIDDIQNGIVRFIGNPDNRIKEDYLRIMRFFRFSARYGTSIDTKSYNACIANKAGLSSLSKERILSEFNKILLGPNIAQTLKIMSDLLDSIFEFKYNINLLTHITENKRIEIIYTMLLIGDKCKSLNQLSELNQFLRNFRLSKEKVDSIMRLVRFANGFDPRLAFEYTAKWILKNKDIRELLIELLDSVEYMSHCVTRDTKEKLKFLKPMPVSGRDILSIGLSGKDVGKALDYLLDFWIRSVFTMSKQELLKCLEQ